MLEYGRSICNSDPPWLYRSTLWVSWQPRHNKTIYLRKQAICHRIIIELLPAIKLWRIDDTWYIVDVLQEIVEDKKQNDPQ